eukprot:31342-Pelagococcus_subviridis.AAC.37
MRERGGEAERRRYALLAPPEPPQSSRLVRFPKLGSGPPPTAARHLLASSSALSNAARQPSRYASAARAASSPLPLPRSVAAHAAAASSPARSRSRSVCSAPHSAAAAAASPSELTGSVRGSPAYVPSVDASAVRTRSVPTSGSGRAPHRTLCGESDSFAR